MRGLLMPAAIAAALSFTALPAAFAAQAASGTMQAKPMAAHSHVTKGTVAAFDASGHTLKLKNGATYMLPAAFKDPGIKVGEKVRLSWNMKQGKHQAQTVTPLR